MLYIHLSIHPSRYEEPLTYRGQTDDNVDAKSQLHNAAYSFRYDEPLTSGAQTEDNVVAKISFA